MFVSSGNDAEEEQAALLLQLAASKNSPTNATSLHQLVAGNRLSTTQGTRSYATSHSMINNGNSTDTINITCSDRKTSQGKLNSAIPLASQQITAPTSFTSKATTGQFDDAPESLDSLLSPHLASIASRSFAESIPASHSVANENARNKQQQQQQQQQQQNFQNTQHQSQAGVVQSQWETAARQAHSPVIRQQQERDFYLSMAAGRPPLLNPPRSMLLPRQQYPIATVMETMHPKTMAFDTYPDQTANVREMTWDIDYGRNSIRVSGKRQSQALAAIRRSTAQNLPQSQPMSQKHPSVKSGLDQLQPLAGTAAATAHVFSHEFFQVSRAPTSHELQHAPTNISIDGAHHMSALLSSENSNSHSFQNGSMPSLTTNLVAGNAAHVPGSTNHGMVNRNILRPPDLSPQGTTKPIHPSPVANLLSKRAAKHKGSETKRKTIESKPDLEVSPPPVEEKDTWLYNLEAFHPSPQISLPAATADQSNNTAFVWAVSSDLETKRRPIPFEEVTRYDILTGRGSTTNSHEGNIRFRQLGSKYRTGYLCSKKCNKRDFIGRIIHFVRQGRGRFLQRDSSEASSNNGGSIYYEIGDKRAYAKLSQTMREGSSIASMCRKLATTDEQVESVGGIGDGGSNSSVGGALATKLANLNQKIHIKNARKRTAMSAVAATVPPPEQEGDTLEI